MSKYDSNLVWIDMEMIGFDLEICVVMEIVIIVMDVQLNIFVEGFVIVVYQLDSVLDNMDEWCMWVYGEIGLIVCCCESIVSE